MNTDKVTLKLNSLKELTDRLVERNKKLKSKLEADEISFKSIAEFSTDGFWDWDVVTNYKYMSPRFWEIFGFSAEKKPHSPDAWKDLIHPGDLKKALENLKKHIETKGEYPYYQEVRYKHKDGSVVWVLCKGKVVKWSEGGEPLRMVGTHTDITYLKGGPEDAEW